MNGILSIKKGNFIFLLLIWELEIIHMTRIDLLNVLFSCESKIYQTPMAILQLKKKNFMFYPLCLFIRFE